MLKRDIRLLSTNRSAICNKCFPGPTRVLNANGISITFEFFSLGDTPTDRPTDHATRSFTIGGIYLRIEVRKGKEEYSYSAICILCLSQSAQARITQFYLKIHHACLSFVSVHQMAPLLTKAGDIQLQLNTRLSTPKK